MSGKCKRVVGHFFGQPLFCNGAFIPRIEIRNGKTYVDEICDRCGENFTLDQLVLKEKEVEKTVSQD
jgi:hypothetical protein